MSYLLVILPLRRSTRALRSFGGEEERAIEDGDERSAGTCEECVDATFGLTVLILALEVDLTGGRVRRRTWLFDLVDSEGLNLSYFSYSSCLIHSVFLFYSLNLLFLSSSSTS